MLDKLEALQSEVTKFLKVFISEKDKHGRKSEKTKMARKYMKLKKELDVIIVDLAEAQKSTALASEVMKTSIPEKEDLPEKEKTPVSSDMGGMESDNSETSSDMSGMESSVSDSAKESSKTGGMGMGVPDKVEDDGMGGMDESVSKQEDKEVVVAPVAKTISKPVGYKGKNIKEDAIVIQNLLNKNGNKLVVDGICGKATIKAIISFQKNIMGVSKPDGRVDPDGKTLEALNKGALPKEERTDIWNPVGNKGKNDKEDTKLIQRLLNENGSKLVVDGICGKATIAAIKDFQHNQLKNKSLDGLVEVGSDTWKLLMGDTSVVVVEKEPVVEETSNQEGNQPILTKEEVRKAAMERNLEKKKEEEKEDVEAVASAAGEMASTVMSGGYKYYVHSNWEKSTIWMGSGRTAKPLNKTSTRLLRSILAGAGISKAKVTSTYRTYSDQAYIVLSEVTKKEAYDWYSWIRNNKEVFEKYSAQHAAGGDKEKIYKEYGEWIEKNIGLKASNHLSGIAIDISKCDLEKFNAFASTLVPIPNSGVKKVFPETGRTHIEFTFKVC